MWNVVLCTLLIVVLSDVCNAAKGLRKYNFVFLRNKNLSMDIIQCIFFVSTFFIQFKSNVLST